MTEVNASSEVGTDNRAVVGIELTTVRFGLPARKKLLELIADVKADDLFAPVTVVVTDGDEFGGLQRRLISSMTAFGETSSGKPGSLIAVSSKALSTVAMDVIDILAATQKEISTDEWLAMSPASDLVLGGVIRKVLAEEESMFSGAKDHPATEQALFRIVKELSDLIDEQLAKVSSCSKQAKAVVKFFGQVQEKLKKHNLYLRADVLKVATEYLNSFSSSKDFESLAVLQEKLGTALLYLPIELKHQQSEFVKTLSKHVRVEVVAGVTGDDEADRMHRKLLKRLGLATEMTQHRQEALEISPATGDQIISTSDPEEEVRWVVRAVMSDLVNGIPADQIAILYPSNIPYARLVADCMDGAELAWYGAANRLLSESVVGRFVKSLAELICNDMSRVNFFKALSGVPVLDENGKRAPISAWERIARNARVVDESEWAKRLDNYALDTKSRKDSLINSEDFEKSKLERLEWEILECNNMKAFTGTFKSAIDEARKINKWEDYVKWLHETIKKYLGDLSKGSEFGKHWSLWQKSAIASVLDTISQLLDLKLVESEPSIQIMCRTLINSLNTPVKSGTSHGHGILVGLLDAGVDITCSHVYVLGLAEGVCPKQRRSNSMISEDERQSLNDILPFSRDHISKQRQELISILEGVRSLDGGVATLLYPRGDQRESVENFPSRWLLDTAKALEEQSKGNITGNSTKDYLFADGFIDEEKLEEAASDNSIEGITAISSFTGGLLTASFPATRQEFDAASLLTAVGNDRQAVSIISQHKLCKPGSALAQANELIKARHSSNFTRFDGNLEEIMDKSYLKKLVFENPISASSLQTWAKCPRAFFFGKVLGVSPIEDPENEHEISPINRGNITHEALDELMKELIRDGNAPGPDNPYSTTARERLNELINQKVDELDRRGLAGFSLYGELARKEIQEDMSVFPDKDMDRGSTRGTVIASEYHFGLSDKTGKKSVRPVEYLLPNGNTLILQGSIDRVEIFEDDIDPTSCMLGVIDYKTGSSEAFKKYSWKHRPEDHTAKGTLLQHIIYGIAAAIHFGKLHNIKGEWQEIVKEATYWFITSDKGEWQQFTLKSDDEESKEEFRKRADTVLEEISSGIAGGIFPAYVSEEDDSDYSTPCKFCSPDGLNLTDLRKQWEAKRENNVLDTYRALVGE